MKRHATATIPFLIVLLVAGTILLQQGCVTEAPRAAQPPASANLTSLCASNMVGVWWLLKRWEGEGDRYPPSLSYVANETNASLFLCPGTGSVPGRMSDVDGWTDFFYAAQSETDPQVAMLLSPPEDHGGRFGLVVWEDGEWSAVTPEQFTNLVQTPWCMAPHAPGEGIIPLLKKEVTVHVPKRFRQAYTNAYSAAVRTGP